jgi:glutamate dehydrogenase/leucine dehydrogenase
VSYEIPLPMPDELQKKPIRSSIELHKYLEEHGFKPLSVTVDNAGAKVVVHFDRELSEDEKKELSEAVIEFYRKHIGLVKTEKKSK